MEGFKVGRKDSFLESVDIKGHSVFSLVSRGSGVEILHQSFEQGTLFYVYPSEDEKAMEFYYVISGELEYKIDQQLEILGPEDYFTVRGLKEPIYFTALSNLKLLCVFTEQTFFHISNNISNLMDILQQVEKKDRYTHQHSNRVAKYSVRIAQELKLNKEQLENLTVAALLHDIGKIHVPTEVLNKTERLTEEEFTLIKKHPSDGAEMVKDSYYSELAPIIMQHHERLDGSGYPSNLKADEILLESKIIAVSDTFDAMTEDRAYRKAFSPQFAVDELKKWQDRHYDRDIVEAFEKILKEEGRIE